MLNIWDPGKGEETDTKRTKMSRPRREVRIGPQGLFWTWFMYQSHFYIGYIGVDFMIPILPVIILGHREVQQPAQGHTASKEQHLTPGCLTLEPALASASLSHSLTPAEWLRLSWCVPLLHIDSCDGPSHFLAGPESVIGCYKLIRPGGVQPCEKKTHSCTVLSFSWSFSCYINGMLYKCFRHEFPFKGWIKEWGVLFSFVPW